jgi:hypothetical protein
MTWSRPLPLIEIKSFYKTQYNARFQRPSIKTSSATHTVGQTEIIIAQCRHPVLPSAIWRYIFRWVIDHASTRRLIHMTGTAWHEYQPPTDKEKSFKLLDAYLAAGGNFFDTANGYSVSSFVTDCRKDFMS